MEYYLVLKEKKAHNNIQFYNKLTFKVKVPYIFSYTKGTDWWFDLALFYNHLVLTFEEFAIINTTYVIHELIIYLSMYLSNQLAL